jgi:hypothetical protein
VLGASQLLSQIFSGAGAQGMQTAILTGGGALTAMVPGSYKSLVGGNLTGTSALLYNAMTVPGSGLGPGTGANPLSSINPAYDSKIGMVGYRAALRKMNPNFSDAQISDLITAGQNSKTNPLILAAQYWKENSWKNTTTGAFGGKNNVMHITQGTAQAMGYATPTTRLLSMTEAGNYDQYLLKRSGGNLTEALDAYGPGGSYITKTEGGATNILSLLTGGGQGVPANMQSDIALSSGQQMASSARSFSEVGPFLVLASIALKAVSVNASNAANALDQMGATLKASGYRGAGGK